MSVCVCVCEQGFSDSRYGDIILVRPMRDYSAKEIAYYNRMFSVPSVFIPSLDTKVRSTDRSREKLKVLTARKKTAFSLLTGGVTDGF